MDVFAQITTTAQTYGVDPRLAYEVAIEESGANPDAPDGQAGEIGIFQLKPSTAAMLGVDPRDPIQNIIGGVKYIAMNLATFGGDAAKAIAAYNAGPGTVKNAIASGGANWFSLIPSSTQSYVSTVLNAANQYTSEPGGSDFSAAVGGISLSSIAWALGVVFLGLLAWGANEP